MIQTTLWGQRMGRRRGIDGRELILSAALRLFSEQGFDAVSIRSVNREAGLGPAAVHYHFGTKEALVDAVLQEYGETVITSTKRRAQEILEGQEPIAGHDLVTMLAAPYFELITARPDEGVAWVRVVASLLQSDPARLLDRSSARLTWRAAERVYPDASPRAVQRAMRLCCTLLVSQLGVLGRPQGQQASVDLALLIDFLGAGLDATLRGTASHRRAS